MLNYKAKMHYNRNIGALKFSSMVMYAARLILLSLFAVIFIVSSIIAIPGQKVYAISNPDSTPTIEGIWAWRNILETGDTLWLVLENTPYASTPTDYGYSEAFIWRLLNGSTELGQTIGYDYNESGFGYNVVGFYLDSTEAPAWSGNYTLTLSGNPAVFASPPEYSYPIPSNAYSALTDSTDVQAAIAERIITIAGTLRSRWGLTADTTLIEETETATVLSLEGQSFFRGAVYGLQGMAPAAFPLTVTNITYTDRVFTPAYATNLTGQHAGTYIETGFDAGEDFLGVDYNLMGMLLTLGIGVVVILANWQLAGGNNWKWLPDFAATTVIATRIGLFGMGELALIAAVCWLYIQARLWKII